MPELPEVETIAKDLNRLISGKKLVDVVLLWPKSLQLGQFSLSAIKNKKILSVNRVGKSVLIDFSPLIRGLKLHIHLKMTGQLVWRSRGLTIAGGHPIINAGEALPNKFTRIIFEFSDGKLYFNDVRKFGWVKLLSDTDLQKYQNKLGLEPMSRNFTWQNLKQKLMPSSRSLKAVLLDQSKLVGLGNIYVDEALFEAKLKPIKKVSSLKNKDWELLTTAIKKVLNLAIKHRGTSFSDYRDASGSKGNYLSKLKVYGRGGKPCLTCGKIIKKVKLAGRGTHFCELCQK